jgi:hypothetical protein
VINVVTKSGSNQLHGTDFYFIRDSPFGATQPTLDFKPHAQPQQFGFTLGVPSTTTASLFFGGLDQHIFHVLAVIRLVNGSSIVVPQADQEPLHDGDYESSDQAVVFAAAARLSTLAGEFPSRMVGNAGFFKLDFILTPHEALSTRISTSRHYGLNNVFLDHNPRHQPPGHQPRRTIRPANLHQERITHQSPLARLQQNSLQPEQLRAAHWPGLLVRK